MVSAYENELHAASLTRCDRDSNDLELRNRWLVIHLRPKTRRNVRLNVLDHRARAADLDAVSIVEIVGQPDAAKAPVTVITDDPYDAREGVTVRESPGVLRALKFCAGNFEAALCGAHNIVRPQVARREACRDQNKREEQIHQPSHAGKSNTPSRTHCVG